MLLFGLGRLLAACAEPPPDPPPQLPAAPLPVSRVDPFIGSGGGGYAQPQVFVGATRPFGMAKPGPDTSGPLVGDMGFAHTAGYWYLDDHIKGFSQLHLHGTGVEDYGNLPIMPVLGMSAAKTRSSGYRQRFSHEDEEASPGYYRVRLEDTGIEVELSASARASIHRYHFPSSSEVPTLIFNVTESIGRYAAPNSELQLDSATGELSGWMLNAGRFTGEERAFKLYFSATVDVAPRELGVWRGRQLFAGELQSHGTQAGAWLGFDSDAPIVTVRVGLSFIDIEQARENRGEVDAKSFEQVRSEASARWEEQLSVVRIRGGSEALQRSFYSALYHCMLMPTLLSEADGRFVGLDRQVHDAAGFTYYSDFSGWDTYRTLHPLMNLLAPDHQRDFARSLLTMGTQHGALPRWPLAVNATRVMLGSPASIILAESVLKGIAGIDAAEVLEAAVADADGEEGRSIRSGNRACLEHGYCPADQMGGSVSRTVEYSWADFAIARLAEAMEQSELAERFRGRARAWASHFDPDSGFLRGRNSDGSWSSADLDPEVWTEDFVEGDAWQYLWSAPFDVAELARQFGSREAMLDKLDRFFELSRDAPTSYVGGVAPFVAPPLYYWHGNEPDIHAAYLYALAGEWDRGAPWLEWVREQHYDDTPDGLAGNDDAGTLSAWFVFTALGFYPLAGSELYIVGRPLFPEALLQLGDRELLIRAEGHSEQAIYVQSLQLNGVPVEGPLLTHEQLMAGGELVFKLGEQGVGWGRGEPPELLDAR